MPASNNNYSITIPSEPQDNLRELADEGNAQAQFEFAVACLTGQIEGIPVNLELMLDYFIMAAEQNYPGANYNVGVCYERGIVTPVNLDIAMEFYSAGSNHGCALCMQAVPKLFARQIHMHGIDLVMYDTVKQFDYYFVNLFEGDNGFAPEFKKYVVLDLMNCACSLQKINWALAIFNFCKDNAFNKLKQKIFKEINENTVWQREINKTLSAYCDASSINNYGARLEQIDLSEEHKSDFLDAKTKKVMHIPVTLNGANFDFNTLYSLPIQNDGFRLDPIKNKRFTLRNVFPNKALASRMEFVVLAAEARKASMPKSKPRP